VREPSEEAHVKQLLRPKDELLHLEPHHINIDSKNL
jgi:hypothetical protein